MVMVETAVIHLLPLLPSGLAITVDSENLVRAPFCKKSSASIRQTPQPPWSGIATEMRVDIGHAHLCTL